MKLLCSIDTIKIRNGSKNTTVKEVSRGNIARGAEKLFDSQSECKLITTFKSSNTSRRISIRYGCFRILDGRELPVAKVKDRGIAEKKI